MFCGRGSRVKTNYMGQTLLDIHQIYCILQLETIFLPFCVIYTNCVRENIASEFTAEFSDVVRKYPFCRGHIFPMHLHGSAK